MIFTLKYHNEKNAITTKKYIMMYLLRGSFIKIINPNSNCIAPVIIVEYIAKMINELSIIERIVRTNGSPIAIVFKYFIIFILSIILNFQK